MFLACSPVFFHFLNAAIELELFDIIESNSNNNAAADSSQAGGLSARDIASFLKYSSDPKTPQMLDRILHVLASYSLLRCRVSSSSGSEVAERLYELAPAGKYYLKSENSGASLVPLFTFHSDQQIVHMWSHLKDALLDGVSPANKAHGITLYELMTANAETIGNKFSAAMTGMTGVTMKALLASYKGFQGIGTLVDIGGGNGTALAAIISAHPSIKGINFDLPHVIEGAPSYPGIEHVGGDMFVSVPTGDAILLKHVLHNWGDEQCVKLLKSCHEALPRDGKVIVMDALLPSGSQDTMTGDHAKFVCLLSGLMLCHPGGKERTEEEFIGLCKESGFSSCQFVCSATIFSVMEFHK
uniref:Uncharacterized protein n=1 Tax=Kalanchoe fedtschenkoi TaxID=63787 RepID=A0A7N0RCM5_KALFE